MAFEADCRKCYLLRDEKRTAVLKLEGDSYHQGHHSVETYIDRFAELLDLADYKEITDAGHLASKILQSH